MNIDVRGEKVMSAVAVGTTAVAINTNNKRLGLTIRNNSTVTVYLGGSAVTALTGFPLKADEILTDVNTYTPQRGVLDGWYGITATGTADLRLIEYVE